MQSIGVLYYLTMPRFVAFLRAINVGGHNVKMVDLRGHFESLGFDRVETFIASGNVIFDAPSSDTKALELKIGDRLREILGYNVVTMLRTQAEVEAIARYQPFSKAQREAASLLYVGFVAEPLGVPAKKVVMALKNDNDDFHVRGREIYWLIKVRQMQAISSAARLEKSLKVPITFRGINTVVRLAAKHCASP
jgi:uncharacterized protein (DUF1697 family)